MIADPGVRDAVESAHRLARQHAATAHEVVGDPVLEDDVECDLVDTSILAADGLGDLGEWSRAGARTEKLRDKGMRGVYALGLQPTTSGPNDGNNLFRHFLIAYGGNRRSAGHGGRDQGAYLHHDSLQGRVCPPGALSWNDTITHFTPSR